MPHTSIVGNNVIQRSVGQHINLQGTCQMGETPDSDRGITWARCNCERSVSMTCQAYKECTVHYVTVSNTLMWIWLFYTWTLLNKNANIVTPYHRHLLHDLTQFPNRIHLCNKTNTQNTLMMLNGNKISFTLANLQLLHMQFWHGMNFESIYCEKP